MSMARIQGSSKSSVPLGAQGMQEAPHLGEGQGSAELSPGYPAGLKQQQPRCILGDSPGLGDPLPPPAGLWPSAGFSACVLQGHVQACYP